MRLMKSTKGSMDFKKPLSLAFGVISVVVLVKILVAVLPGMITALINLSTLSDLPFMDFFASGGVGLLIIGVGVFALVVYSAIKLFKA